MKTNLKCIPFGLLSHPAWLACALAGFCLGLAGCSDDNFGLVTGVVQLDGEPLEGATVEFQPKQGSPSYGETDEEGRYELMFSPDKKGAVVGEHVVRISTYRIVMTGDEKKELPEEVPAKYNTESMETRQVEPGSQVINFDLKRD